MDWDALQRGLFTWVQGASRLTVNQVRWAEQNTARPTAPFISLSITSIRMIGHDWLNNAQSGDSINYMSRGVRECVLRIQCFSNTSVGANSPRAILDNVMSRGNLPTYRDGLVANGIGLAGFEPMIMLGGELNPAVFEPRGILEARFYLASEVTDTGGFIEFVEVENGMTDESTFVPEDPTP